MSTEDFNSYAKRNKGGKNNSNENGSGSKSGQKGFSAQSANADMMQLIGRLAGKYEGASENELMSAILAEAKKSRASGNLSNEDIDRFYMMLSPLLSGEQKGKLDKIVKKLKES